MLHLLILSKFLIVVSTYVNINLAVQQQKLQLIHMQDINR